jgi:cell division protein FtsZ
MTLHEVYEAASFIEDHADDEANIIFGATIDETLEDRLEITVIATGFGENNADKKLSRDDRGARQRPRSSYKVFTSTPKGDLSEDDAAGSALEALPPLRPGPEERSPLAVHPPGADASEKEEAVFELNDPILEPIETAPQIPSSYRPEEKRGNGRSGLDADLDIPTFIRRRSKMLSDD